MSRSFRSQQAEIINFLNSLGNEGYVETFKEIYAIVNKAKNRDDDYLRRHQNKVRIHMQDHIDMYDKEAREWSDELIARVKSDLSYLSELPDTPEARARFYDTFEGRVVKSLTEYRYNIKKHKNRLCGTMSRFDLEVQSHLEIEQEESSKCLLGAFLKLKEHEDREESGSVIQLSDVEEDQGNVESSGSE